MLNQTIQEEVAFYESGLDSHGCSEMIDDYMRESIVRYGRILSTQLTEENLRLRRVLSRIATNIGNGSVVSEQASIEFIEDIPREVELVCQSLRKDIQKLISKLGHYRELQSQ